MMIRFGAPALLVVASLALAGCGASPGGPAVSTGLLGAGTGAALGAIAGNAGLGAAIGGATGVVGGAVTSPRQASLGPSPLCY
jgi:hypothetical protein